MSEHDKLPVNLITLEPKLSEPLAAYKNWFNVENASVEFWKQSLPPLPPPPPPPPSPVVPPAKPLLKRKKLSAIEKAHMSKIVRFRDRVELDPGSLRVQPCMYMNECALGNYCTYSHVKWYNKSCSVCGMFTDDYSKHQLEHRHIAALSRELAHALNKP